MKKLGLGLIGLGYIGKVHLRNCLRLEGTTLEAVADSSKFALKEAKRQGVKKTYSNYEDLLRDPNIDGVIIALPTHIHLECVRKAAEAGKHILLEKPIARNVAEATEILHLTKKNSVHLMMGYPLRFNSTMYDLKKKLNSGELGDIVVANATNISTGPFMHRAQGHAPVPVPEWWFKKELTGGGALIDLGAHMINLLRWFFGEISSIRGLFGYRFNLDVEDSAICLSQFKSGTKAIINVGYFSQKTQLNVELLGTADHATVGNLVSNPLKTAVRMLATNTSEFWQQFFSELACFANCIRKDLPPSPSVYDGLRDIEAIETAYKNTIKL